MRVATTLAAMAALTMMWAPPGVAQPFPGPYVGPVCAGPFGPVPCGPPMPPMPMPPMPPPGPYGGAPSPVGFPPPLSWQEAARMAGVPNDGVLVAQIGQKCGPDPACMAAAWGAIELSRCQAGIGVPGGCFGPNGEIFKGAEVLTGRAGPNNDLVGKDGWLCRTLFGGC